MTRKTVKQALPAVDLKEMIVTALRSETMALYRRFAKEKSNDEVFTQDSRLGRIIVSLYGLIQWLFPDDQEISENFIYLVSARFPGYRHVADATVPSEPQEIPVNEAATIPTPSKVLEMPQHTTPVTALSEVKHVETPTGEVAPPVQNTEINTLLDFFQNVPNGTKPYDFSRKVREAYFGTSFTEIKEVLHTVIKRLPHLVDPEALRDCVAHQRDVELAQFFVQRGERILDTAQINQPAFVGVKGAMYAIAGMHDVANNPNVKAELEGKMKYICSTLLEKAQLPENVHRFITAISYSGVIKPPDEQRQPQVNRPTFPTANEARQEKGDDRPQGRKRENKLYKSHPDEGRGGAPIKRGGGLPSEKYYNPSERPLSKGEQARRDGPDTSFIPDRAAPRPDPVLSSGISLDEIGKVHRTGGSKTGGGKTEKVMQPHVARSFEKENDGGKPESPNFIPPTEWVEEKEGKTTETTTLQGQGNHQVDPALAKQPFGVEPPPVTDFNLPKSATNGAVNGLVDPTDKVIEINLDHAVEELAQPASAQ